MTNRELFTPSTFSTPRVPAGNNANSPVLHRRPYPVMGGGMKRAARAILLSALAFIHGASVARAQFVSLPVENAHANSNSWFFFPDQNSAPRILVKGNQNNQSVPIKILEGGPPSPHWTATSSANIKASGLSTFVQTGSGSGKMVAAHVDGTRSIQVIDFANGVAVAEETAASNIPASLLLDTLSAAVDSAGFVHIVYTLASGSGATNSTLVYLRRNVATGEWARHQIEGFPARIRGTSILAPTTGSAVLYFTTQALHRCTLDSLPNGNPIMDNFSLLHTPAQGIVSGAVKATRVAGEDRILYFYSTGSTTWQFARMDFTSVSNFAPVDIQDVGSVSGSVALPLSIHVATGTNGKEHIAWYDLRSRRIHYLLPGTGSDGIPYNASQPVTLPNQPSGVPDSNLLGLHIRASDGVPFLLYRRALNMGFVAVPQSAVPLPEIAVLGPTNANINDNGSLGFGTVTTGEEETLSLTIKNTGDVALNGILPSIVPGTASADYTITSLPATTLAPNASSVFTVRFVPGANGKRAAKLQIASDDLDENPFDINLSGTGGPPQTPEIGVSQGKVVLTDGVSEAVLGNVTLGKTKTVVFTISNGGLSSLTGIAATLDGANAGDFTIIKAPLATVAGRKKTTVSVKFTPSALGERTAVLHIASNDADENPFDLVIKGTGMGPEIAAEQPAGSDLTDGVSSRDFGSADIGANVPLTFTVRNDGNVVLKGVGVKFIGGTPKDFILTAKPVKSLAPAASTTFTVTFRPKAAGLRTTTLRLTSNDADERFFEVALSGTGNAPPAALSRSVSAPGAHPLFAAMNAAGLEGVAAEPEAEPHGDGVGNLLKYAFNLDLAAPDCRTLVPGTGTAGLPVVAGITENGTTVLRFEYLRRKDAGLVYLPKFSADLKTWSAPDGEPAVTPIDEVWERVAYELPAARSGPRFAIVEVGFAGE
jgi:hypothetical protein